MAADDVGGIGVGVGVGTGSGVVDIAGLEIGVKCGPLATFGRPAGFVAASSTVNGTSAECLRIP